MGDERVTAQVEERHAARAVVHLSLPYLYTELGDASAASAADFTYLRVAQGSPLHHEAAYPRLPAGSSGLHAARWPSMAEVIASHHSIWVIQRNAVSNRRGV